MSPSSCAPRTRHRGARWILVLLGVLFVAPFADRLDAQAVTGSLQGRVLGPSGEPEALVAVTVSGPNLQGVRTTTTGRDGFFRILALPPGTYSVRLARVGLRPTVLQTVGVLLGREATIGTVTLEAQPVALEELVIEAPASTVDPVHTTVGANLDAAEIKGLPAQRDYSSVIAILPHVNEDYRGDAVNAGGQTGPESMYFIDGVNVSSPVTGGGSHFTGSSATSLPYNFIRSIEVKTGGYEAQYGRALGAVVNAVTYSGTNRFEANLFGFFTHGALTAKPKAIPTLREADAVSYDVGVRLGGPILRNRLWYSAAYNPRIDRVQKQITGHGFYTDRRAAHLFAGKLTWQAVPAMNVELSVFGNPTAHHEVTPLPWSNVSYDLLQPDPYLRVVESGDVVASLRATVTMGERLLLEGSLARETSRDRYSAETEAGRTETFLDHVERTESGGIGIWDYRDAVRVAAVARATLNLSRHTVTGGVEYEDASVAWDAGSVGRWGMIIQRVDSALYVTLDQTFLGTPHNRVPTVYLQDTWRVTDRLTLNGGIRWSSQHVIAGDGSTAQTFPNEWQPRAGFVLQLGRPGTQRLFGSYGRFYQQEPLWLPMNVYVGSDIVLGMCSTDPRDPSTECEMDVSRGVVLPSVDGAEVEHLDEFTLGFERMVGPAASITLRGIHRTLRSSFQWGWDLRTNPAGDLVVGTPGKGDFDFLPPPKRDYTALELGIHGAWRNVGYRASYVLSRSYGNYSGFFNSDLVWGGPGGNSSFWASNQRENTTGLLPNDRTHVLKLTANYQSPFGLSIGGFFSWQSGNPLSEWGAGPPAFSHFPTLLQQRGSMGRTPSLWDVNLRLAYEAPCPGASCRFLLDALHIGNPQRPVWLEELHYLAWDDNGEPMNENPAYGMPKAYQPPMMARVGVEIGF